MNMSRVYAATLLAALSSQAVAQSLPSRVATCVTTRIDSVGTRLEDRGRPVAGSGSAVTYANRASQVSYDDVTPSPNPAAATR